MRGPPSLFPRACQAWSKVQKVVDRERAAVADKIDKVAKEMAEARQYQAALEARVAK